MEQNIQPLNRVALHMGGIQIYWYGIIIGVGVLLGLWLAIESRSVEVYIKNCLLI